MLEIRPHPKAPLFSDSSQAERYLAQVIAEVTSQNPQYYGEILKLIRQAGYVNLWFFLKFVCGYSGPYEMLGTGLDMEMCNFAQSDDVMLPGTKYAVFLPRGFKKSTIFTTGLGTWVLLRNPDERLMIMHAVHDQAKAFMWTIKANFDSNELVRALYPEYVPGLVASEWTKETIVLPNRTRYNADPSVRPIGVSASKQGKHPTWIFADDLLGLDDLTNDMMVAAGIEAANKCFRTDMKTLLVDWNTGKVGLAATFYSNEDTYNQEVIPKMWKLEGYQEYHLVDRVRKDLLDPFDRWTVYYRNIVEDGVAIRGDQGWTKERFEQLQKDDPWTASMQYENKPFLTSMNEFYKLDANLCKVYWNDKAGDFLIRRGGNPFDPEDEGAIRLRECDCVMVIDPAGVHRGSLARACRTSIGIWAMDSNENVYRIWGSVGHYNVFKMIDEIFRGHSLFPGKIRQTIVESNAYQSVLQDILEREQLERKEWINPLGVPAKGDKISRIRHAVGRKLLQGKLYLAEGFASEFLEEKNLFPNSKTRVDVLDEAEKGIISLRKPDSDEETWDEESREEDYLFYAGSNAVGY